MSEKTIAVDFDGVLHAYSRGWQDGSIYDPPQEGARDGMYRLMRAGFHVVIYSTRCEERIVDGVRQLSQADDVARWLRLHEIPFSEVWTKPGKPIFLALIDDRAIRHERAPWWKRMLLRLGGVKGSEWHQTIAKLEGIGILRPGDGEEP